MFGPLNDRIGRTIRLGASMLAAVALTCGASLVFASPASAATTLYVGPGGGAGNCLAPAFATIQAAVAAAASGDTISVCPGSYGGQVTISGFSGLTVVGSGATQSILEPSAPVTCNPTETTDDADDPNYVAAIITVTNSTGVALQNLGVDGTNIPTDASITCGVTFPEFWGIWYNDASGSVSGVAVSNIAEVAGGVDGNDFLAQNSNSGSVDVTDSTFTTFGKNGIVCVDPGTSCSISGNTVTGSGPTGIVAQNGIVVGWGATGTVSGNSTSAFDSTGGSEGVGIALIEVSNVSVTQNAVTDAEGGIEVQSFGKTTAAAMTGDAVTDNIIQYSTNDSATFEEDTVGIGVADYPGYEGANATSITATVDDNLIDGPGQYSADPVTDDSSAGLVVGSEADTGVYDSGTVTVTAEGNLIDDWSVDAESLGASVGTETADINYNEFIGATAGFYNGSGPSGDTTANTPDATDNWWGCAAGPGTSGCTTVATVGGNTVNFAPWLASVKMTPTTQNASVNGNATVTATLLDDLGATVSAPLDVQFSTNPGVATSTIALASGMGSFTFTSATAQLVTVVASIMFGPLQDLQTSALAGSATVNFGAGPPAVIQIFGQDPIGTSIAVSQAEFPTAGSAGAVVLARDDFFSDALAGGPLAAYVNGPMLLTGGAPISSSLDPRTLTEIQRVLPAGGTVYILGGNLAINPAVDATLTGLGYRVVREAGVDEYATAFDIAVQMNSPSTIFEATGLSYYDALSAVPAAIANHAAILLTNGTTQSYETGAYIIGHPGLTRYAIGGPLAAAGADPGATPVYGQNLYSTSAAVASTFFPGANVFGAATSATFTDALGGGVFMATGGRLGPLLIVNPNLPLPPEILPYLASLPLTAQGYVFGGPLAISTQVVQALQAAIG